MWALPKANCPKIPVHMNKRNLHEIQTLSILQTHDETELTFMSKKEREWGEVNKEETFFGLMEVNETLIMHVYE